MTTFKYQPYYHFNGPTSTQRYRIELSVGQAQENLDKFIVNLHDYFSDIDAIIETAEHGVVAVSADISQGDCDERVKRCLNDLDLFAKKVPLD